MSNGRGIQSIEIGGRLLASLARQSGPRMLRDLAQESDLVPAQAHAYLSSLCRVGLVEQDSRTGQYRLGAFAMRIGLARLRSVDLYRRAGMAAHRLSEATGLMVILVAWGPQGPAAVQVSGGASLNLNIRRGTTFALQGTAAGHVFVAWSPQAEAAELDRTAAAEVEATRERGYGIARNSPIPGISAFSAPVFDAAGRLALALTIVGASDALPDPNPVLDDLLRLTRALSLSAGTDAPQGRAQA